MKYELDHPEMREIRVETRRLGPSDKGTHQPDITFVREIRILQPVVAFPECLELDRARQTGDVGLPRFDQ